MNDDEKKKQLVNRACRLLEAAKNSAKTNQGRNRLEEFEVHISGFAEPGYDATVVVTGNFNKITRYENGASILVDDICERLSEILERVGVDIQWSDEWTTCCDCHKLVRTSPDGYDWKRSYTEQDGEVICRECTAKDPESYLAGLEGVTTSCVTLTNINPADHGYVQIKDKLQNGLHEGMGDDPKHIGKELVNAGLSRFLFVLDEASQFYVEFSCWLHEDEKDRFDEIAGDIQWATKGPTPADRMKQALQTVKFDEPAPGCIAVTTIDVGEGTSTTKQVTRQDFIKKGIR